MKRTMTYQIIDHPADFGLEVTAADLASLFADTVLALFDVVAEIRESGAANSETLVVQVSGDDWPDLMVNWLREVLYQWTGEDRFVVKVEILSLSAFVLSARLHYETFDPVRHTVLQEIKAVTYHQIRVAPSSGGWTARVVFDI
ncbi:archease [Desulfococcus sp.]|uniref:archease n=1 Tax=Desulfococcus sp. TaxID=2025834 RepID=UPI003D10A1A4